MFALLAVQYAAPMSDSARMNTGRPMAIKVTIAMLGDEDCEGLAESPFACPTLTVPVPHVAPVKEPKYHFWF